MHPSSANLTNETDDDEEFRRAFGGPAVVPWLLRGTIDRIRKNDPGHTAFRLVGRRAPDWPPRTWELLGRYVARNDHLERVLLVGGVADETLPLLFGGRRAGPSSPKPTDGGGSLPRLKEIDLADNDIRNISPLEKYTHLEVLGLRGNNIGLEGCKSIARLLQNQSSSLRRLNLEYNNVGDEEAKIIASSLERNNKLTCLHLQGNQIEEDGRRAFLKLLNDISSIDRTYNSNHTLSELKFQRSSGPDAAKLAQSIDCAIRINKEKEDEGYESDSVDEGDDCFYEEHSKVAGRKKVIAFQLDGEKRMMLCRLQRTGYCYSSLFADIDPVLLPDILSIVGGEHGQNELYLMLIESVSGLASIVDRKVALRERIAENMARVDALNAEHTRKVAEHMRNVAAIDAKTFELKRELESIEFGGEASHDG